MRPIARGSSGQTIQVFIQDSTVTTGAGKTGLAYNTSGLSAYYVKLRQAAVQITLATQTVTGAWSSGGFVEIDATNMPGWYRLDPPDAAFTSVNEVGIQIKGTGIAPCNVGIPLTGHDPYDGVRLGLTALPNVAADGTTGGLPTIGTGTGQISLSGGRAKADVERWANTPSVLVGGLPSVDASTIGTVASNAVRDAVFANIVDDSGLASAAALTSQITFRQFCSLGAAYMFGRTSNGGQTFSTPDNAKVRITGTAAANVRTAISLTPSG